MEGGQHCTQVETSSNLAKCSKVIEPVDLRVELKFATSPAPNYYTPFVNVKKKRKRKDKAFLGRCYFAADDDAGATLAIPST